MIEHLHLTNFKRHENLSIDFAGGLNCLRGANEIGKSTIYHAIGYAFYGSRALPMTLEETVTYDKPVSSLKVEMRFNHDGQTYTIIRSKSGASLIGNGVTASGQGEVTAFVERLLGLNLATAPKIMIANQSGLKGALEGGNAVQLIEQLSDMDMIDALITAVQAKLPCGQTTALDNLVASGQQYERPVADFSLMEVVVTRAATALREAGTALGKLRQDLGDLPLAKAQGTLLQAASVEGERRALIEQKETCESILAEPPLVVTVTDIGELRKAQAAQTAAYKTYDSYQDFVALGHTPKLWFGTRAEFDKALKDDKDNLSQTALRISTTRVEIATLKGQRINEDSCALCGKLLQDVPEVVATNAKVDAKLAELETRVGAAMEVQKLIKDAITFKEAIAKQDTTRRIAAARITGIEVLEGMPCQVAWLGEVPTKVEHVDYERLIKIEEGKASRMLVAKTRYAKATEDLATVTTKLAKLVAIDTTEAESVLTRATFLEKAIDEGRAKLAYYTSEHSASENALAMAQQDHKSRISIYEERMVELEKTKQLLKEYNFNNALIKHLREARPHVAKLLWGTVLHSISHYFSQVRGQLSSITKSDSGFLVNGKPSQGLSGSTLDALGLAVRMALQKTFLPNLDFMLLDEPASGMDDVRETALLGVLAASGYNQTVVVTHSDLADSFASHVVQL